MNELTRDMGARDPRGRPNRYTALDEYAAATGALAYHLARRTEQEQAHRQQEALNGQISALRSKAAALASSTSPEARAELGRLNEQIAGLATAVAKLESVNPSLSTSEGSQSSAGASRAGAGVETAATASIARSTSGTSTAGRTNGDDNKREEKADTKKAAERDAGHDIDKILDGPDAKPSAPGDNKPTDKSKPDTCAQTTPDPVTLGLLKAQTAEAVTRGEANRSTDPTTKTAKHSPGRNVPGNPEKTPTEQVCDGIAVGSNCLSFAKPSEAEILGGLKKHLNGLPSQEKAGTGERPAKYEGPKM